MEASPPRDRKAISVLYTEFSEAFCSYCCVKASQCLPRSSHTYTGYGRHPVCPHSFLQSAHDFNILRARASKGELYFPLLSI